MKNAPKLRMALFAIILLFAVNSQAQTCTSGPGCLDPSFGTGGKVHIPLGNNGGIVIRRSVLLSDGKIVALASNATLGTSQIIKVNVDGSLDTSFGSGGIVDLGWFHPIPPGGVPFAIGAQMIDGEELIVIAGSRVVQQGRKTNYYLRVDRRHSDGSLDASFGTGGTATSNAGAAIHMTIQPLDQKIVTVSDEGTDALTRLNADGSVDTSFGNNGTTPVPFWGPITMAGNDFLIGGSRKVDQQTTAMAVAKISSSGSTVAGFGVNGVATANFGSKSGAQAYSIREDALGNIIAAGTVTQFKKTQDFGIARFSSAGILDTSFNGSGRLSYDHSGASDHAYDIAVQGDGRMVVGGLFGISGGSDFGLMRFWADGTRDTTFGANGVVSTDIFISDTLRKLFVIFDTNCNCEKLLAVGQSSNGLALARYLTQ